MSCQCGHVDSRELRTLLVEEKVQAVLRPVLLELRVGDELGHDGGEVWEEEGGV